MPVVPKPPAFDAKTFSQRLHERVLSVAAKPYAVFDPADDNGQPINFPRFTNWVKDMRNHVEALRVSVHGSDGIKPHLDALDAREAQHHAAQAQRLTALEEAVGNPPFPG